MPLFNRNERGLLLAILAVVVATIVMSGGLASGYLVDPETSAIDILRQTAFLGIFALGSAVVIVGGGIDLSCGSVIAFAGTTCATLMVLLAPEQMANATPIGLGVISLAIVGTIVVGILIGTLHAALITVVGLPPFVATLATLVGLRSLGRIMVEIVTSTVWDTDPKTQIQIYDSQFRYLAQSVWIPVVLFMTFAVLIWLMMSRTVVGRHIYALGGNEEAARLSGIRTNRVKWLCYCLGSVLSTVAGILYIGDQSVADPQTLGRGYELNAIAAAVVGGCSLQGGVGTIQGTVLGCLFLRMVIDSVAKIIKGGADVYEGLIVGVVVVVAVSFSQLRRAGGSDGAEVGAASSRIAVALDVVAAATLAFLVAVLVSPWTTLAVSASIGGGIVATYAAVQVFHQRRRSSPRIGPSKGESR